MTEPVFGKDTRVRFVGGSLLIKQQGESLVSMKHKIEGLARRAQNLTVPFDEFQEDWFASEADIFAAEGLPEPWPALSPAYQRWKEAHYPGQGIMVASGRLMASLTGMTADTIWASSPRALRFGTSVPYQAFHQTGTFSLPVRRTLLMLPDNFAKLIKRVEDWVFRGQDVGEA